MNADIIKAWRHDIFNHTDTDIFDRTTTDTDSTDEPVVAAVATRPPSLRKRAAGVLSFAESPKRRRGVLSPIRPNMSAKQPARQSRTRRPTKGSAIASDGQPGEQEQTHADGASPYRGGSSHVEDSDGDDEIVRTPRAGRQGLQPPQLLAGGNSAFTKAIALQARRPEIRPNPTPSISSMSSQNLSTTSKRSRSPVKSVQDLGSLETPVYWDTAPTAKLCSRMVMRMCPGSIGLVNALGRIVNGNTPYIPAALREELEDDDNFECPDNAFFKLPEASETTLLDLQWQLKQLRRIVRNTAECQKLVRGEPAWNDDVHKPNLSLAAENTPDVRAENVTRASIARPFLPPGAGLPTIDNDSTSGVAVSTTSGKMVDYALALQLPQDDPLRRCIGQFLHTRTTADGSDAITINPTTYRPLKYAPAGVFVETKADSGSADEGRTQLGLWVAAWFRRIEALKTDSSAPLPMLPLLLVLSDTWDCYFACRVTGEIRIVGPLRAGSTANLASAYRVHAVLQEMSRYVNEEFRHWVEQLVGFDGVGLTV